MGSQVGFCYQNGETDCSRCCELLTQRRLPVEKLKRNSESGLVSCSRFLQLPTVAPSRGRHSVGILRNFSAELKQAVRAPSGVGGT